MAVGNGCAGLGRLDRSIGNCFGVTGMVGCLPTVSPAPVTAQVTITL
jgi:hypothetical protein